MVGATGFEPATSCSRSRRSTGLSYAPPDFRRNHKWNAPRRTRTSNLRIRSQMLYPIELWALEKPNEKTLRENTNTTPATDPQRTCNLTATKKKLHGRYKTRTCDLHDVNVAL